MHAAVLDLVKKMSSKCEQKGQHFMRGLAGCVLASGILASACGGGSPGAGRIEVTIEIDQSLMLDFVQVGAAADGKPPLAKDIPASGQSSLKWTIVVSNPVVGLTASLVANGKRGTDLVVTYAAFAQVLPGRTVTVLMRLGAACAVGAMTCSAADETCDRGTCIKRPTFGGNPDGGTDAASTGGAGTGGAGGGGTGGAGNGGSGGTGGGGTGGASVVIDASTADADAGSPGSGGAIGTGCMQGSMGCTGLQPQTCDASGQWQSTGTPCPNVCTGGTCSGTCPPNSRKCRMLQPQVCDAAGQWVDMGSACPMVCNAGTCAACVMASKQCNGLQPQTCDANGAWQSTGTACMFACNNSNGTCTGSCMPGAKQCSGLQPQTCDANGAWQNTGAACSGCFTCSMSTGTCASTTGTTCGPSSCAVDAQGTSNLTPSGSCDATGTCVLGTARVCPGALTCVSGTACKISCGAPTDCAPGNYCAAPNCLAKKGTGSSCAVAGECITGFCVDGVCCSTVCSLVSAAAGMCMGCSNVATGGPNGTCAGRNGSATRACPAVTPTACVNTQTDADNCGACGTVCSGAGFPTGVIRACRTGTCGAACPAAGNQICVDGSGIRSCESTVWGFEGVGTDSNWTSSDSATSFPSTEQHHTGSWSYKVYAATNYSSIYTATFLCNFANSMGMDLRGRTLSAWIWVPAGSSPSDKCYLAGSTNFGASATKMPLPAATWFQLSGTFSSTDVSGSSFTIGCDLTPNASWIGADGSRAWYVDDVRID